MQESNLRPIGYRSNPFTRHRRGYKLQSPGIQQPGQVVSYSTNIWAGSIPSLRHRRFATASGKSRAQSYRFVTRTKRRRFRTVSPEEVSAHCATEADFLHGTRERSRCGAGCFTDEVSASFTTHDREGNLLRTSGCSWIQQRRLCASDERRREEPRLRPASYPSPSASGDRIGNWWSLFLPLLELQCHRLAVEIKNDCEIILFVTFTDTNCAALPHYPR